MRIVKIQYSSLWYKNLTDMILKGECTGILYADKPYGKKYINEYEKHWNVIQPSQHSVGEIEKIIEKIAIEDDGEEGKILAIYTLSVKEKIVDLVMKNAEDLLYIYKEIYILGNFFEGKDYVVEVLL